MLSSHYLSNSHIELLNHQREGYVSAQGSSTPQGEILEQHRKCEQLASCTQGGLLLAQNWASNRFKLKVLLGQNSSLLIGSNWYKLKLSNLSLQICQNSTLMLSSKSSLLYSGQTSGESVGIQDSCSSTSGDGATWLSALLSRQTW